MAKFCLSFTKFFLVNTAHFYSRNVCLRMSEDATKLLFCTTGTLLRMIIMDTSLLSKVTHLIIVCCNPPSFRLFDCRFSRHACLGRSAWERQVHGLPALCHQKVLRDWQASERGANVCFNEWETIEWLFWQMPNCQSAWKNVPREADVSGTYSVEVRWCSGGIMANSKVPL